MDAFKEWSTKFRGMLRKRGKRPVDAEDLVQDAFVRLLQYIEKGNEVRQPEAFLARTVLNLATDHARREREHLYEKGPIERLGLTDVNAGPEDEADSDQRWRQLVARLEEHAGTRTRDAFILHYFGFTYDQIGKRLGIRPKTVEQDLAKANTVLSLKKRPKPQP